MASIKFKVTREDSQQQQLHQISINNNICSGDFLSPHVFAPRNSLSTISEYSYRRRRPITLKIMPRLSLPARSTSAPASTTETDWTSAR
ncbi:hypothetical protein Trydic_g11456 [Trypoxylus dichotomus]